MSRKKPQSKPGPEFKPVTAEIVGPGGRPTKYKPEYCQKLLAHMQQGGSYETFGNHVGVHKDTLYEWEKQHPEFSDAKKKGMLARLEMYETAARNIALGIVPPPPEGSGAMMTRGNAAMAMFMLKNIGGYRNLFDDRESDGRPGSAPQDTIVNFNITRLPEPKKEE